MYRLLFEQSGTFKNEFKKLGFEAMDYDILNDFGETDVQCDLYKNIEEAYNGKTSIFDSFSNEDIVIAFFPCTRFEDQILLHFRGDATQQKKWSIEEKLKYNINLHNELNKNYEIISKMVIVLTRLNIPIIIENPYSEQHYLSRYWCIKSTIIDYDRTLHGDYFKKPTQYWFIGITPKNNNVIELERKNKKTISNTHDKVKRSLISKEYANYFIREYLIGDVKDAGPKQYSIYDLMEE